MVTQGAPSSIQQAMPVGPVPETERIDVVDILRGWAILGMLVVNFSHDLEWRWWFTKLWPGSADRFAYFLLHFFAAGKFHALFSFLFGWGFALQMDRAEARGARFSPLYARRLFVLLLIGLTNWVLFDWDSTLVEYALAGYLLFLFRARSLKIVVAAALLCNCYWPAYEAVVIHKHTQHLTDPGTAEATRGADIKAKAEEVARAEENLQVRARGRFFKEIVPHQARGVARDLSDRAFYFSLFGYPFPLLLLGLYVGRQRILQTVPAHLAFIRKVFWWGLILGVVGSGVGLLVTDYPGTYRADWDKSWIGDAAFYQVGVPALCFFYASAIILLAQKATWKRRLAPLAPVGRMALSNYLLQVLIFKVLTHGLGLYGRIGPLFGAFVGLLVFMLQLLVSIWWMKRFRFGPAEWLWRTLTYGKLQPMRMAHRPDPGLE
jgi:uncharacterized protein